MFRVHKLDTEVKWEGGGFDKVSIPRHHIRAQAETFRKADNFFCSIHDTEKDFS